MTRRLVATFRHTRIPRPVPQAVILGLLIVATLVMPVSYRAGSDTSHAHTVFQGVIDLITGHAHHHDTGEPADPTPDVAFFSPVPTPLLIAASHVDQVASPGEQDVPELLGLSVPISALASIQDLRLLLLTLLASVVIGRLWGRHLELVAVLPFIETPPPRPGA